MWGGTSGEIRRRCGGGYQRGDPAGPYRMVVGPDAAVESPEEMRVIERELYAKCID